MSFMKGEWSTTLATVTVCCWSDQKKVRLLYMLPFQVSDITPRLPRGVKKIENRAEKLHTYATFWSHLCQKLDFCKSSRAQTIFKSGTTWKKKDCSICSLHSKNYATFTLTTRSRGANICDKYPKSKSCRRLFGWCCCFRAYRLIIMEWNVKRIVPCKRWENSYQVHIFVC